MGVGRKYASLYSSVAGPMGCKARGAVRPQTGGKSAAATNVSSASRAWRLALNQTCWHIIRMQLAPWLHVQSKCGRKCGVWGSGTPGKWVHGSERPSANVKNNGHGPAQTATPCTYVPPCTLTAARPGCHSFVRPSTAGQRGHRPAEPGGKRSWEVQAKPHLPVARRGNLGRARPSSVPCVVCRIFHCCWPCWCAFLSLQGTLACMAHAAAMREAP